MEARQAHPPEHSACGGPAARKRPEGSAGSDTEPVCRPAEDGAASHGTLSTHTQTMAAQALSRVPSRGTWEASTYTWEQAAIVVRSVVSRQFFCSLQLKKHILYLLVPLSHTHHHCFETTLPVLFTY